MNFRSRSTSALAAALVVATLSVGLHQSPASAADRARLIARGESVTVTVGAIEVVPVLANDRGYRTQRPVRLAAVPRGVQVWTVKARTQIQVKATRPGRFKIAYRVLGPRRSSRIAHLTVTANAQPTPQPTTAPTVAPTAQPTVAPTTDPTQTPTVVATPTVSVQPTPTLEPTTTPTTTTSDPTPAANTLTARINALVVTPETIGGYSRTLFPHWNAGLDPRDGCDTRAEVLKAETLTPITTGTRCPLTTSNTGGGTWHSYYDGVTTTDPSSFDIDHMVPLAEAWASGANAWTTARREAFANDQGDPRSLVAVSASSNRGKGDQDPGEWQPLLERCRYIGEWVAVKTRWSLTVDQVEKDALLLGAQACPDTTLDVVIAP